MPNLIRAVQETTGDVCELGAGVFSTPLLHWICLGRQLVTYENNADYYEFIKQFRSNNHKIRLVKNYDEVDFNRHWSVVLIDQSVKKPLTRGDYAIKFKNADLIVLHDTEPQSIDNYGYEQVFKHFKYRYDWTLCVPHCSVVSNVIDVTKWQN